MKDKKVTNINEFLAKTGSKGARLDAEIDRRKEQRNRNMPNPKYKPRR